MLGKGLHPMMPFKMCLCQLWEMQGFMSCGSKPMFSTAFFLIFSLTSRHCYVGWWHLHIGDVIIIDPIQANLVSQVVFSHGVIAIVATQVKEGPYHDCYLANVFLLLAIEIFGCLHLQFDSFFINVLTWYGQQRAPKAFIYWCCVPFIDKKCEWLYRKCMLPPFWSGLLL